MFSSFNIVIKNLGDFQIPLENPSLHPKIITYCNTNLYKSISHWYLVYSKLSSIKAGQDQKWLLTCTENKWSPNWHYKPDTITFTEFCILYRDIDCDIQLSYIAASQLARIVFLWLEFCLSKMYLRGIGVILLEYYS